MFQRHPQSCSLTDPVLPGCDPARPDKTVHCGIFEQSEDSPCKSKTCEAFTRESDSCPQSCPTKVGKDAVFWRAWGPGGGRTCRAWSAPDQSTAARTFFEGAACPGFLLHDFYIYLVVIDKESAFLWTTLLFRYATGICRQATTVGRVASALSRQRGQIRCTAAPCG